MVDREPLGENALHAPQQTSGVAARERDQVGREGDLAAADGPDVEVMHFPDLGVCGQGGPDLIDVEEFVQSLEGVETVCTLVGQGASRFMLTYAPEEPNSAYGQLLVTADAYDRMAELMPRIDEYV